MENRAEFPEYEPVFEIKSVLIEILDRLIEEKKEDENMKEVERLIRVKQGVEYHVNALLFPITGVFNIVLKEGEIK